MKKFIRFISALLSVTILGLMGAVSYYSYTLPDNYRIFSGDSLSLNSIGVTTSRIGKDIVAGKSFNFDEEINISLLGIIPIKQARVKELNEMSIIPCGTPFGVKLLTDGVMIINVTSIATKDGNISPAANAGLKAGDVIISIDGVKIKSNQQLRDMVLSSDGKKMKVRYKRQNNDFETVLLPVVSSTDNAWQTGVWVRDSSAGIGTITFCTGEGIFGGLGHPICDVDTGDVLPLGSGEIVGASISGVKQGTSGNPGELCGVFLNNDSLGNVEINTSCGLYGRLKQPLTTHEPILLGLKQEATTGKATIYSTISGEEPKEYEIEIESIDFNQDTRNYV
ncbi:MAG: PDZ domain-containing protein, partial [Oscillospiraceae bacterium]|nr:PDZ domain-containing protein [Oscillospiraceae bacterium]